MNRKPLALIVVVCLSSPLLALAQTASTAPSRAVTPAAPPISAPPLPASMPTNRSVTSTPGSMRAAGQKSNQFTSEIAAKSACGTDPVVWANLSSKAYHTSGTRYFGKTKRGAYMCQGAANSSGYHQSRGG